MFFFPRAKTHFSSPLPHPRVIFPQMFKCYFDLETTGLGRKARIVQIGAIVVDDEKQFKGSFNEHVRTTVPMSKKAAQITGITDEFLSDKSPPAKVFHRFLRWLAQFQPLELVAYNGFGFDFPVWSRDTALEKIKWRPYVQSFVDPLVWARANLQPEILLMNAKGRPCFKLGSLYKSVFQREIKNAHDALADCRALRDLCEHPMFGALQDEGPHRLTEWVTTVCYRQLNISAILKPRAPKFKRQAPRKQIEKKTPS